MSVACRKCSNTLTTTRRSVLSDYDIFRFQDVCIANHSDPSRVWVLFLPVKWETHVSVKGDTVASISQFSVQIDDLKKSRRPEETLHLSRSANTSDPLVCVQYNGRIREVGSKCDDT